MKTCPAFILAFLPPVLLSGLLPVAALAGAQYTAEDVIRYFEQANATAAHPGPSVARTAPAAERGIVIGDPAAQGSTLGAQGSKRGVVIGNAPATTIPATIPATVPAGDAPLAIPMTGAKAGHVVPPAETVASTAVSEASVAPEASGAPGVAPGMTPGGYDMLVTFEVDSATLTPQARQNLDAFATALASPALSALRFAVEGHTDATGSPDHNLELSERRAASVVTYLVAHGVAADRLTAQGFGETRPRLSDPEHPENRRVETRPLN